MIIKLSMSEGKDNIAPDAEPFPQGFLSVYQTKFNVPTWFV